MASLFEPNVNQVTPVQDTKVFDALGNIYNFLSKQSQDNQQRKQEQQRINDSLNKPNIEILLNSRVTDVVGDSVIESIVVNERTIPVSGLFIASGSFPNNDMFRNVIDVKENGYFDNSNFPKTKTEGIYIAGDCVDKELRQIATAVSDGAIAATAAIKEMKGE
jgi:thioredoxin reductase (NADPH)